MSVDNLYHQGIRDLAPSLSPMGMAVDGLMEAVWQSDRSSLWAVQWYPELGFMFNSDCTGLPSSALLSRHVKDSVYDRVSRAGGCASCNRENKPTDENV